MQRVKYISKIYSGKKLTHRDAHHLTIHDDNNIDDDDDKYIILEFFSGLLGFQFQILHIYRNDPAKYLNYFKHRMFQRRYTHTQSTMIDVRINVYDYVYYIYIFSTKKN